MDRSALVVEGEASESDEELPIAHSRVPAIHPCAPQPPRLNQSVVVSGEASESSEEETEIDTTDNPSKLTPLQVKHGERGDSVDLSSEASSRPSSRLSQASDKEPALKYDTLLHGKLRERNASLRRHLCDSLGQVYISSAKEIRNMTHGILKSQIAIQDVSHNMGVLTNNLFHLEDKVDIIASCELLPVIHTSPSTTPANIFYV